MKFSDWEKLHPWPSLAEFIAAHGGVWSEVPRTAWAEWDAEVLRWLEAVRLRHYEQESRGPGGSF